MKTTLFAVILLVATSAAVAFHPGAAPAPSPIAGAVPNPLIPAVTNQPSPRVDAVFVLDTTGSMDGLIAAAKEKIWSIATTMSQAQPAPELRLGLVAYRDRGDDYVTRVVDLSEDLDSVYAMLMDFAAGGGGDGPESVNQALYDAVHKMSWSQDSSAYKVVFLVGDAPPHMDYQDEVKFPLTLNEAARRGIVVNTIQCGDLAATAQPWQQIARLGGGRYFEVEQAGSALALTTPYDEEIARLSAALDDTRLYYGDKNDKAKMAEKEKATAKLHAFASTATRARRATYNASAAGTRNALGELDLLDALDSGRAELDAIEPEHLPAAMQAMAPEDQREFVEETAARRSDLKAQITGLAGKRADYLRQKVEATDGAEASLDHKIFTTVREQAGEKGLVLEDAPAY
ncbi:MAG: vWA domain-containing protein [Gammaproteobacteria bacterium]